MDITKAEELLKRADEVGADGTILGIFAGFRRNRAKNFAAAVAAVGTELGRELEGCQLYQTKAEVIRRGNRGTDYYLVLWLPEAYRAVTVWY